MKIGLLALSGVRVRNVELASLGVTLPQFVSRGKVIASLPSLGLLTVAGLTPKEHDVHYIELDEIPANDDLLEKFDLVGISSFSARINEAYKLSARYQKMGTKVVLGGLHVTMNPDEAINHADAIVVNGAEGAWCELLKDVSQNKLKKKYIGKNKDVFNPNDYKMPRFDFLKGRKYNRLTVQTSRGCPLNCEFCAASVRLTSGYQQKPVDVVMSEIKEALKYNDHPFLELADDNTFINHKWSKEFLTEIKKLKIKWFTETDISIADHDDLLEMIADSGCQQILIGFESPDQKSLENIDIHNFKAKKSLNYLEAIEKIQSKGITINGCFVLGLDSHTKDTFKEVAEFVKKSKLLEVQVTVLTPFPGTPLYDRLKKENRLLPHKTWDDCTLFDVNFIPKNMSVLELEEGMKWLFKELYNEEEFLKRKRHYMEIVKSRFIE